MSPARLLALATALIPATVLATDVSGTLSSNTTWTPAGNPWVLTGDVTIPSNVTLTLQPGVQVTFATTDSQRSGVDPARTELIVLGKLLVQGTSASPITFTATGAYGVRVLNLGSATFDDATLNAGLFGVVSTGNATFNRTTIQGATTECLHVDGGTTTFSTGTLRSCTQALVTNGGSTTLRQSLVTTSGATYKHAIALQATTQLNHNTITGNTYGAVQVNVFTGTVTLTDNIISSNASEGIFFSSSSSPARTVQYNDVWNHSTNYSSGVTPGPGSISVDPFFVGAPNFRITELSAARMAASDGSDLGAFPYTGDPSPSLQGILFSDKTLTGSNTLAGDLTIRPGATLTLAPGASLTFAATDGQRSGLDTARTELIVDGTLNAQGTTAAPITLTATNAYGVRVQGSASFNSVTIAAGLYGVRSSGTSTLINSTIQGASNTCLNVTGGTTSFSHGILQNCSYALVTDGGTTEFRHNLVRASGANSSRYALSLRATATLVHNTIASNNYGGVQVVTFSGNVEISDNIIASNGAYGISAPSSTPPTLSIHHNDLWGHSTFNLSTYLVPGPGSISANPLFVSSSDFHLSENSPARMAASDGTDLGALDFAYAGQPTTSLQGILFSDKLLTGANTLDGDLTIRPGVTLTLAPGASLTFASTDGLRSGLDTARVELIVDGTLAVQGTSEAPATLTATGAYGIRVQGSATLEYTTLSAGLYGVISAGSSTLHHSTVQGASNECLRVTGGTLSFTSGTLQSCPQALLALGGTIELRNNLVRASGSSSGSRAAIALGAPTTLVHNTITGNTYGAIQISNFSGAVDFHDNLITSNGSLGISFTSNAAPTQTLHHNNVWDHVTNYRNELGTLGPGSISAHPLFVSASDFHLTENSPARLAASDGTDIGAFTYSGVPTPALMGVLFSDKILTGANTLDGDLTVRAGVTLTLAPGASLMLPAADGLRSGVDTARTELIVDGTLVAQGTSTSPITLMATGAYGVRIVSGSATFDSATVNAGLYGVVNSGTTTFANSIVQGATTECLRVTGGTLSFTHGTLRSCPQAILTTGGAVELTSSVVHTSGASAGSRYALSFGGPATLVHNSIIGNTEGGVLINKFSGDVDLHDNLIASSGTFGLYFNDLTLPTRSVHHNNVWGHRVGNYAYVSPGAGGISANPLLVSATDFRPTENSPVRMAASDGTEMGAFAYEGHPTSSLQGVLFSDKILSGANTLDGDLTIRPGVTLTLTPGASLTFAVPDGLRSGVDTARTELIVDGTLAVQGTLEAPVTLNATGAYGLRVQGTATLDYVTLNAGLFGVSNTGTSALHHTTIQGATTQCLLVAGGTLSFSHGALQSCSQAIRADGGITDLLYSLVRTSGNPSYGQEAIDLRASAHLVHNTITGNTYRALRVRDTAGPVSIYDNIITARYPNPGFSIDSTSQPRVIHHNDVWDNGTVYYPIMPSGPGGISANPLFVSDSDFRLTEYSPARMAASDGTDMGAFAYEGHPTPILTGVLFSDLTLTGANTLAGDLTVRPGVTLTLAPGASLTFATTDALGAGADTTKTELFIDGNLAVQGTSDAPVTFTATGAEGVFIRGSAAFEYATIQAGRIGVLSTGTSTFSHSTIQGADTCLYVKGGTTTFSHGTLRNCHAALHTSGGSTLMEYSLVHDNDPLIYSAYVIGLAAPTVLRHNTITGNLQGAIVVYDFSGEVTLTDNVITSNGLHGIYFPYTGRPARSVHHNNVWGHSDSDYNVYVVPGPGSLSVDPLYVGEPDFSLQATSPCRHAASDGLDMGAFPYVPPSASYVVVMPSDSTLAVQGTQQFTATAYDTSDTPIPEAVITWSASGAAGTVDSSGLFTASCAPGTYAGAVTATADGQSSSATVTLTPGPAALVTLAPAAATLTVQDTQQFTATVQDNCLNVLPSAPVSWIASNGGGAISPSGLFTAGTTPGIFEHTVSVTSGTVSATASVTVNPGPVQTVQVTPASVALRVRGTQQLTATATDAWGNPVSSTPSWSVSSAAVGSIDADGLFTAGSIAGLYPNAVRAQIDGVSGSADLTLTPGDVTRIVVTPALIQVGPRGVQQLSARAEDAEGNEVPISPVWSALHAAGTITPEGLFTAAHVPGTYPESVIATANGLTGTSSVVVAPGPLHRVVLSPQNPTVVIQGTVAFSAKAYDAFDNELRIPATWETVHGGGTIDASGLFTAGLESGTFANTLQVTVGGQSVSTSVTVADDFDGDGMSDAWEVAHGFDPSSPGDGALDSDGDQLSNVAEFEAGTDPHDADTDDDGVIDGREPRPNEDTDGDGLPNVRDPDSDGDGLFDGTEMAVSSPPGGTDVSKEQFAADADPSTSTDPLTADTDGDGRKDGEEDANHNGLLDPGETDPNTPDTFCSATPECGTGKTCQEGVCVDAPSEPQDENKGCGCSGSGAGGSVFGLLLLSLLGRIRRLRWRR
ncbi:right-handed parallel beta-helix repeat-containing protein [Hyalangium versicolor]|uniref:right-handed parallel beta-helix repeat-containing protein n=1 Tax=Hyalangium versicolor TaxID=2861190 RepID=UPI001CCEE43B|nr:right-handed parallel beta-helix repeat-containing protein [Hyalangium versicolor]